MFTREDLHDTRSLVVSDTQRLSVRRKVSDPITSGAASRIFDFGVSPAIQPSLDEGNGMSGAVGFLRFAIENHKKKKNAEEERARREHIEQHEQQRRVHEQEEAERKCPHHHGIQGRPDSGVSREVIPEFRGGNAWKQFDLNREVLSLDIFWPVDLETPIGEEEIMPREEMSYLCNFRNLRFLKLTGMSRSYQKYIWQTVWLNPGLEELELEMALEPCVRSTFNANWPSIKGSWDYRTTDEPADVY